MSETRSVCPACGHISGAHLDRCRIAQLERELHAALIVSDNYAVRAEHAEAELAAANAALRDFEEKADAIHRYMNENKMDAVMAVVAELRANALKRAAEIERARKG